ncbi:hypothetical protein KKG24_00815 [Patescibacteria group bacterium]|nr:hypothetical protein [Patescibacteria group bacterium]
MIEEALKIKMGDPSKSSLREEVLDLEFKGIETKFSLSDLRDGKEVEVYVDKKTGEEFYKIYSENGPSQRLLSMLLKGVINVSDVVRVRDEYYSHHQNLNLVEASKDVKNEAKADLFIIFRVFGDSDHIYYENSFDQKTLKAKNLKAPIEHHNLILDEENKKLTIFDFHKPWIENIKISTEKTNAFYSYLEDFFEDLILDRFGEIKERNLVLPIIKRKVKMFLGLFSDEGFKMFEKMIKRSGVALDKKNQKDLFDNLKLRLEALAKALEKNNL